MLVSSLNDYLTSRFANMNLYSYTNSGGVVLVDRDIEKVHCEHGFWKFYIRPTVEERREQPDIEICHVFKVDSEFEVYPHYELYGKEKREKWQDGDIFTTQEFNEAVNCGGFIDYDGNGTPYIKSTDEVFNCYLNVQQLAALKYDPEVTHIIWYNK